MTKRFVLWKLIPLLALIFGLFPPEQVVAQPRHFSPNSSAQELIDEVNALRASNGLTLYKVNSILMDVAQIHADYLADRGIITHFSENGNLPYQRALAAGYPVAGDLSSGGSFAEAIHSGANLSPAGAVTFWQADAANSDVMLSAVYEDIGVGVAVLNGITYYVLNAGLEGDAAISTATATLSSSVFVISTAGAFGTPAVLVSISTPLESGEIFHVVQKNEALWSIALAYDTTVDQLKFLNGLATDEIFEGQTLLVFRPIPDTVTPAPTITATFGIPTSTPTKPVTPTKTATSTPVPVPPASRQSGGFAVGLIVLAAMAAAGIGAWLGRKKSSTTVVD